MGWKFRACSSWYVFAAVIVEEQDGNFIVLKQKVSLKDNVNDVSLVLKGERCTEAQRVPRREP